jgi:hypothetical protein
MRFFIALCLLVSVSANAAVVSYRLDTSSPNLATTFPNSPQITGLTQITAIQIDNQGNQEIEINCANGATKPSVNSGSGIYVASASTFSSPATVSLTGSCFMRAYSSAATSGVIRLTAWGW